MNFNIRIAAQIMWEEQRRYLPGVIAITFSALLISLQTGIFFGLISTVSIPIVESRADIWVMYPETSANDLARSISADWKETLLSMPEVASVDEMIQVTSQWTSKNAVTDAVVVLGVNPLDSGLGPTKRLTPEQRSRLTEPGSVIIDYSDRHRLEISGVGDYGEVNGETARVVGFMPKMTTLTGSCIICSMDTAREFLHMPPDRTTFLLVNCRSKEQIPQVVQEINDLKDIMAMPAEQFANRTMMHWISKTKAGIAVAFFVFLGIAVGGAVTSQTLYAATATLVREFAALRALGIPRYRMRRFVVLQSLLMSFFGIAIGIPLTYVMAAIAEAAGTEALLPFWLLAGTAGITFTMGIASGLFATRSLRHSEPADLLR